MPLAPRLRGGWRLLSPAVGCSRAPLGLWPATVCSCTPPGTHRRGGLCSRSPTGLAEPVPGLCHYLGASLPKCTSFHLLSPHVTTASASNHPAARALMEARPLSASVTGPHVLHEYTGRAALALSVLPFCDTCEPPGNGVQHGLRAFRPWAGGSEDKACCPRASTSLL